MSEDIKKLGEDVNALIKEYRELKDDGDIVRSEQLSKMADELKADLKELRDVYAAANTPKLEASAEEQLERYKEAFGAYLAHGADAGNREGKVLKIKDVSLNVAAEGGVLLPKVFSGSMTDILRKASPIRGMATVVRSGQNYVHPVKTAKGSARTRQEKGAISTGSTPAFDMLNFVPTEVYDEQAATAWAHDGDTQMNLVDIVLRDVLGGIGEKESELFINGTIANTMTVGETPVSVPMGLSKLAANTSSVNRFTNELGKLSGVENATANALTFDDIIAVRQTLHSRYLSNASYLMGSDAETQLIRIKDENGNYILTAGDVTRGVPGTLFGNPYNVCDFMPNLTGDATTGNSDADDGAPLVIFGDFSKYIIVDHSDIRWTVDPLTDKTVVKYLARRRLAAALSDFQAMRAIFNKAD